jgi:Ca2+-binding EF-hand superfamily protein
MSKLTDEQKKVATEMFNKFDADKSGTIEYHELKALLESTLAVKLSDKMYERYVSSQFSSTDKNDDKAIQLDEFLVLYEKLYTSKELPISLKPNEVSMSKVVQQPTQTGMKVQKVALTDDQKKEADAKFKEYDLDNSGTISREELAKIISATSKTKLSDMMVNRMVNSKRIQLFILVQMQVAEKEGRSEVSVDDWYTVYASLFTTQQQPIMGMGMPMMGMKK